MLHSVDSLPTTSSDMKTDVLVIGAGAGGMSTALFAKRRGLDVILCEKTNMAGGITATSGGTVWAPGTALSKEVGPQDSIEDARRFLRSVVGDRGGDSLRDAFLEAAPAAIAELHDHTDVRFAAASAHPDYRDGPGGAWGGRALAPLPFDGRKLGKDFARVRPPRREFLAPGGMMVNRSELDSLLKPFSSIRNFYQTISLFLNLAKDRISWSRGTRLVMGNALVGRLLLSLRKKNIPVLYNWSLDDLIATGGTVTGARFSTPDGERTITARRAVVLATGGIATNRAIRNKIFPFPDMISLAPTSNSGDGVEAGLRIGAGFSNGVDSPALWMPCSTRRLRNGTKLVWPHIILDRAKPGLLAVSQDGLRFVNESNSYHDFCMGMIENNHKTAWLICDRAFLRTYGLGMVWAGTRNLRRFIRSAYLVQASSIEALAEKIGVDPSVLEQTVTRYNALARSGEDTDFGRGSTTVNRFNGDARYKPNPCMRPVGEGPYYAMAVQPGDLATSAGLTGDINGQVTDKNGVPIQGLYACGNDLTSLFRGTYPGPGTTLGPALVMAWRIATHLAGNSSATNMMVRSLEYVESDQPFTENASA
ncbi:FAD-dependent oxidoreductase [Acetobacter senegalensis]|uniref:FAD-dependent oxidoreductase n=1 Tax=Acetobacter senegalensis TaxID=446692 RepID=UPI0020A066F6|nr:FAD-dependent oxidoreductase [Acetobacter senegalensis]MCP1196046.1 FAD-dependent oxidoreductase [Acetobacter senegalensis]